jgi:lysophospholipase L1-like esterase
VRRLAAALAVSFVLVAAAALAGTANATAPVVGTLAALGDSITRAFDTCSVAYTDCPANSWSTGSNTSVDSWYLRLRTQNPSLAAFNDAKTGAKMADLPGQAATAVSQGADAVTILMGANDVCTSSVSTMTPSSTVAAELTQSLQALTTGNTTRRIYVASIPNVYHLWEIFHLNWSADFVWGFAGICQSLLANPRSTATADVQRRAQVSAQVNADNSAIQQACAAFAQCRYDNGAAFDVAFTTSDVTTRDYFHPNVSGQAKAAAAEWNAFFGP